MSLARKLPAFLRPSAPGPRPARGSRRLTNGVEPLESRLLFSSPPVGAAGPAADRTIYAVNETGAVGSISVYDVDAGHKLVKTIRTVPHVADLRGVAASARTQRLYVSYRNTSGVGMIYCLNLSNDSIVWNKAVSPGVDRLAISPDGQTLFVPTFEGNVNPAYDFINVVDAATGKVERTVAVATRTHDTQYPLAGPVFQEAKATDGSGAFLYEINPSTFKVTRVGPYADFLGPYAVDSTSTFVVNNVNGVWGMQVADLKTGRVVAATIPGGPPKGFRGLIHGIGWAPDRKQVWETGGPNADVYVWDMTHPMSPRFLRAIPLGPGHGSSHWLTFSINGDYAYVSPAKSGKAPPTEVFNTRTYQVVATFAASEDMLEVDFKNGNVVRVGDQFGIGRKT